VRISDFDHHFSMSSEMAAIATLAITLVLALLVDRGAPNILESLAFGVEGAAAWTVTALRRSAAALRKRHAAIERAHRERMAGAPQYNSTTAVVSSGSSSAPA
jgi:hypothetical protein